MGHEKVFPDGTNQGTVCCVIGTRPEAIKMAPVILKLRESASLAPFVLATGQHTRMMRQSPRLFRDRARLWNLALMKVSQSLDYITSKVLRSRKGSR
jgi:UDP-N-acetylglucosamine 2-epimerase (non-hydrolysing)